MKVTELSIAERLRELYLLQAIDSKVDEIEILKGELPMEVNDLEDEIIGLETRLRKNQEAVDHLEKEISNHQGNIKNSEAFIVKYEKQLDNVKNNREFDALTKEIEMQKLEIQLSEKKSRESSGVKVSKDEVLAATTEKLDKRKNDLETKKLELEQIIVKTEKEETKLKKQSERAKNKIEPRLLKSYNKIRSSYRNGLAVATVERGACGGCFNLIPAQLQIEIGTMKNIIACEHCGRVMVDDSILEGIKKK